MAEQPLSYQDRLRQIQGDEWLNRHFHELWAEEILQITKEYE